MKPVRGWGGSARSVNVSDSGASILHAEQSAEISDPNTDMALVQSAQQGDTAAFEKLFVRYRARAYAVAVGMLKQPEDAMDVVQEAFIKAYRYLPRFQGASTFYTWLYRIVVNQAIDHMRRKRRAPSVNFEDHVQNSPESVQLAGMPTVEALPFARSEEEELQSKLQEALSELPEHHRAVVVLREIEGMSYEEIASVLGVPRGTVMSRLFHARRKLQVRLHDYLKGES
jgi:RNA polymerase sigma-70 factor (ECF subfamily)